MLLAEGRPAVTVSSTAPFTAVDATGATFKLPKGALSSALGSRGALRLQAPRRRRPPLVVRPGKKAVLALDGKHYRGKLELVPQGGFLRVVNVAPLESYLQGVVAGEVPYSWPAEALKAQAVAARSYALANLVKGKPFDLYSDVRSQVYLGVAGEKPSHDEGGRGDRRRGRPLRRARSRRRTTSRPRAGRPRAPPTCSGSTCRTSSRDPIRGTRPRRTTGGDPSCSARARSRRSSASTRASSTRPARRRPPGDCALSSLAHDSGLRDRALLARADRARAPLDLDHRRRPPPRPTVDRDGRLRLGGAAVRDRPLPRHTAARVVAGRLVVVRRNGGDVRQERERRPPT